MKVLEVRGADSEERVAAYMPGNYRVVGSYVHPVFNQLPSVRNDVKLIVVVVGEDKLGWTAEDYVIPRLGSGLMAGLVIDNVVPDSPLAKVLNENIKVANLVTVTSQGIEVTVDVNQDLADVIDDILNDLYATYPEASYDYLAQIADELGQLAINKDGE